MAGAPRHREHRLGRLGRLSAIAHNRLSANGQRLSLEEERPPLRALLDRVGLVSHIHRRRSSGKPMPGHIKRGNATTSKQRAPIEHVFAVQKQAMALTIRTIGLARAKAVIGRANIANTIRRPVQIRRTEIA